jgi:diguanylate cyclase (GGDEF)-like protein
MSDGSWLLRDGTDRERMLDMDRRLQPIRRKSFGVLAVALVLSGPWLGWWTLLPLVVAGALFGLADARIEKSERPEYGIFAAWTASEVIIAASIAITGGPTVATMSWFAIPIVTLSTRFSGRGIATGVAITLGLIMAVGFGVDASAVMSNPTLLIAPIALVVVVAMLSTVLMQSDVQHRSETVIDQLTGLLNRKALSLRTHELVQQSEITGDPIGVVVCDLDHFKRVNDSFGHAKGDAVLIDVAYLLRKELRAFDLVYRIGGEEFLILLPGSDLEHASAIAEQLRTAIEQGDFAGCDRLTMSFGVAASERGGAFDYSAVFGAADTALYEAKRGGRNQVRVPGAAAPLVLA